MPNYTFQVNGQNIRCHVSGDNEARQLAQKEANRAHSNCRVFDELGNLLWNEQSDDSPYRTPSRYSNPQNDSVF